jgi:protease I
VKVEQNLNGKKVAILVSDGFEQVELTKPKAALEQAGAQTFIVAPKPGKVQGMNHDEKADKFKVDMTLDKASPEQFDAVLLPGGALNADTLRMEEKAREFVRVFDKTGKPMAVICHAPWLLVSAGITQGRKLTSYYTIQDDIRNAGGHWQDSETIVDRNLLTSRQPDDIPAFNREMVKLFGQEK